MGMILLECTYCTMYIRAVQPLVAMILAELGTIANRLGRQPSARVTAEQVRLWQANATVMQASLLTWLRRSFTDTLKTLVSSFKWPLISFGYEVKAPAFRIEHNFFISFTRIFQSLSTFSNVSLILHKSSSKDLAE